MPFTLLEAASRVGGRAHTSSWTDGDGGVDADGGNGNGNGGGGGGGGGDGGNSGDGGLIELGATWLHGTEGHPL